ncbi:Ubx domain-containing protein, partial [Tieghemiomyces parasiticus]
EKERKLREKREAEALRQRRKDERILQEEQIVKQLPVEPAAGEANVGRFGIRLPTGERVIARFRGSDLVTDIYNFVDTRNLRDASGSSDSDIANAESATTLPADYQQTYKFRLVSPMPRQVFEPSNAPICEAFQAVWPSTSLIIEEIEDDSSDEE